jgi:hypothetical protein
VVGPDGRIRYISPALTIDDEFVSRANGGRAPEKRFRFAAPCREEECGQWTGSRCGVIDHVLENVDVEEAASIAGGALPHCAIRRSCRWFAQSGASACRACPLIITDRLATSEMT